MNIQEWWALVDEHWVDLVNCIETFHPSCKDTITDWSYPITAPIAEKACESIRKTIVRPNALIAATKAKESRDGDALISILNETWFGAPESREVFSVRGFSLLCDLCSEYEG